MKKLKNKKNKIRENDVWSQPHSVSRLTIHTYEEHYSQLKKKLIAVKLLSNNICISLKIMREFAAHGA